MLHVRVGGTSGVTVRTTLTESMTLAPQFDGFVKVSRNDQLLRLTLLRHGATCPPSAIEPNPFDSPL